MRWVYILRCEDDYYYVGETKRLYRRFWEHQGGIGGSNTSNYIPEEIVAIYKVDTICKFIDYNDYVNKIIDGVWHENYKGFKLRDFNDECDEYQYDNLYAENNIAECLMIHNKDEWNKIRGGKYTRFDIEYKYPDNDYIKDLPLCKCELPCDIKKNEDKNYLYFRCAKKNMWDKLREEFDIDDEPCNFFMEYTKDKQLKLNENKRFERFVMISINYNFDKKVGEHYPFHIQRLDDYGTFLITDNQLRNGEFMDIMRRIEDKTDLDTNL